MKPVLFVSHNASRTGAPTVMLHLCRWLASVPSRPFEVILGDGGDLEPEFAALGPVTTIGLLAHPARAAARLHDLSARVRRGDFSLVYANTVEVGEILEALAPETTSVLTHVHELDFWIRQHTGLERFNVLRDWSDRFIAVSEAVRTSLVVKRGIEPGAIDLVHEFIDTRPWAPDADARRRVGATLGIPDEALIVGGSGTLDWRKAPDVFVQVAGAVHRRLSRPAHWIWVGGEANGDVVAQLSHDAELLGVRDRMHFVGAQHDPAPFFQAFDLFLSTSREDPYPLVNLEAAATGAPVICFAGAGGAAELVEDDGGAVVPYLDVAGMADAVVRLQASDEERRRAGSHARERVRSRHDVSVAAPQLADVIERTIAAGPTAARRARLASRASGPHVGPRSSGRHADAAMLALYRYASARAAEGDDLRARTLFETLVDLVGDRDPALTGKVWFKLALLEPRPDESLRCCERALALLPTHRAALARRDALMAMAIHG